MEISQITIIFNAVLLFMAFVITVIMLNAGARYAYHYGDTPKQDVLRWRILRLILALIAIGLIASIFNIVEPYLIK